MQSALLESNIGNWKVQKCLVKTLTTSLSCGCKRVAWKGTSAVSWGLYLFRTTVMKMSELLWLEAADACNGKQEFIFSHRIVLEMYITNSAGFCICSSSFLLWQLCSEFWTMQSAPPTACESLMGSDLSTTPKWKCYSAVLSGGWGNLMRGLKKWSVCLRCSVLYGTVEPLLTGKSVHHTVLLLTDV